MSILLGAIIAKALLSFTIGFLTDLVWIKVIQNTNKKKAFATANWSVGLYAAGLFSTWLVVEKDIVSIAAYFLGAYIGTFVTITYFSDGH